MGNGEKIVVMYGGFSAERDVSLRSGTAVAAALQRAGYRVVELDVRDQNWTLADDVDGIFLALHGAYGEDGTIQRKLDFLGIPYSGCDAEASRVAFDKVLTKACCAEAGIRTPRHHVLSANDDRLPDDWRLPVVIKPVRQGSSVGLHFVDSPDQWSSAVASALQYDSELLVEERIVGCEVTVGILDGKPLPLVEVRPKRGGYDYANKYTAGATDYLCPAPLNTEVAERAQAAGLGAFKAIGGRDYARVDVMIDRDAQPWVLEVNTLPGMTETSLLPKAAAAAGISYEQLCDRMMQLALRRHGGKN